MQLPVHSTFLLAKQLPKQLFINNLLLVSLAEAQVMINFVSCSINSILSEFEGLRWIVPAGSVQENMVCMYTYELPVSVSACLVHGIICTYITHYQSAVGNAHISQGCQQDSSLQREVPLH